MELEYLYGQYRADSSPDWHWRAGRGFLHHSLIILDIHEGVKYSLRMSTKKLPVDIQAYFAKMGSRGGKLGGRIRAEKLSDERRSEIARKASEARWSKKKSA